MGTDIQFMPLIVITTFTAVSWGKGLESRTRLVEFKA